MRDELIKIPSENVIQTWKQHPTIGWSSRPSFHRLSLDTASASSRFALSFWWLVFDWWLRLWEFIALDPHHTYTYISLLEKENYSMKFTLVIQRNNNFGGKKLLRSWNMFVTWDWVFKHTIRVSNRLSIKGKSLTVALKLHRSYSWYYAIETDEL